MEITQTYTQQSQATTNTEGTHFDLAAELSRQPVALHAMIKNSLSYAKLMLALRKVVVSDLVKKEQDHSRYQAWVQNEYHKELPDHMANIAPQQKALLARKKELREEINRLNQTIQPLRKATWAAHSAYRNYLYKHEREKYRLLDPVISVHPDSVIFEAFSLDESTYARVSVPTDNLEIFGDVAYGTTNIDFSQSLADELYRVRSYRPAWLKVAQEQVQMSTSAGARLEKKIDLPESWLSGFLQVQSASSLDGRELKLSASTLREIIGVLESKKAKKGPRSIRFELRPGQCPVIILDPWDIKIMEPTHVYQGSEAEEIKIWGRRRLLILNDALPVIDEVQIKLLGTGMPSFWSVQLDGHRLDLGLSGWSSNDWARKSSFDLLAGQALQNEEDAQQVEQWLRAKLSGTTKACSSALDMELRIARAALQHLCKQGKAMYDPINGQYRWRDLFPVGVRLTPNEQQTYAHELVENKKVKLLAKKSEGALQQYEFEVEGKNTFQTLILQDNDGRIKRANCSCGFFKHNKLRKGPCAHLAASIRSIE